MKEEIKIEVEAEAEAVVDDVQPNPVKKPPMKLKSGQSIVLKSEEKGKTF